MAPAPEGAGARGGMFSPVLRPASRRSGRLGEGVLAPRAPVDGVRRMLEEESYCVDILTQVAAIRAALKGFSRELLDSHVRGCVRQGIVKGDDAVVEELLDTIHKIMK